MDNLIFIYGEDDFRRLQTLREIKQRFVAKNSDFNLVELSGNELTPAKLENQIGATPLFSGKRMLVVRDFLRSQTETGAKALELFATLPSTTLLIVYESSPPDQRLALFKKLIKIANVKKIDFLDGSGLRGFIKKSAAELGADILPDAAEFLAQNFGHDLWRLESEIDKLANFDPKITVENIKKLTKTTQTTIVFELTDHILAGHTSRALAALDDLRAQGEPGLRLLGLITGAFRNLATLFLAQKKGLDRGALARTLKIHPFVVSKSLPIVAKLNLVHIIASFENMFAIDSAIKTGKMDIDAGLDLLVVRLAKQF